MRKEIKNKKRVTYNEVYCKAEEKNNNSVLNYLNDMPGNIRIIFTDEECSIENVFIRILPDERNHSFLVTIPVDGIKFLFQLNDVNLNYYYFKYNEVFMSNSFSYVEMILFDVTGQNFVEEAFDEAMSFTALFSVDEFSFTDIGLVYKKIQIAKDVYENKKDEFNNFASLLLDKIRDYDYELFDKIVEGAEQNIFLQIIVSVILSMLNDLVERDLEVTPSNEEEIDKLSELIERKPLDEIRRKDNVITKDENKVDKKEFEKFLVNLREDIKNIKFKVKDASDDKGLTDVQIGYDEDKNILFTISKTVENQLIEEGSSISNYYIKLGNTKRWELYKKIYDLKYVKENNDTLTFLIIDIKDKNYFDKVCSSIGLFPVSQNEHFEKEYIKVKPYKKINFVFKVITIRKKDLILFKHVMKRVKETIKENKESLSLSFLKETFNSFMLGFFFALAAMKSKKFNFNQ